MSKVLSPYKKLLVLIALFLCCKAEGAQVIPYTDLAIVKISKRNPTMIKFSEPIRKAFIADDIPLEIHIEGDEAYLKFERVYYQNINAFFVGDEQTYSLTLIPADTDDSVVYVQKPENKKELAIEWEKGNVYEEMLAELIKIVSNDQIPPGYKIRPNEKIDESPFTELSMEPKQTLTGGLYSVTEYLLKNISGQEISYAEEEFYKNNVVGISIEKHKLVPEESTTIYLVKKEY